MLASNLVSLTVLIISAQTLNFRDSKVQNLTNYFCALPEICKDWGLP